MPNPNYVAGRRFEYDTMALWETMYRYDTVRTAGSHGKYDVIAYRCDRVPEFIQCKRVGSIAAAKRLLAKFEAATKPSEHYHQRIYVKVKGQKELLGAVV